MRSSNLLRSQLLTVLIQLLYIIISDTSCLNIVKWVSNQDLTWVLIQILNSSSLIWKEDVTLKVEFFIKYSFDYITSAPEISPIEPLLYYCSTIELPEPLITSLCISSGFMLSCNFDIKFVHSIFKSLRNPYVTVKSPFFSSS